MDENERTLSELVASFNQQLSVLKHGVMLSKAAKDTDYITAMESLDQELDKVGITLRNLRRNLDRGKKQLQGLENLKVKSLTLSEHLQYTLDNLPPSLPRQTNKQPQKTPANELAVNTQKQAAPECSNSFIDFLTVEEFESVPKYMKGRIGYDTVNSAISKLDQVYCEKYKILKQKKMTLNDVNRKRYEAFKLQENKDTKGTFFIVERDISDFSTLKVDNTLRNILIILRHCTHIHEIRGGGHVRLAVHRY